MSGGRSDFNDLADPGATKQAIMAAANPRPLRFPITRIGDVRPILNGQWLIKHLLPSQGLGVVYGPPASGKTFLTVDAVLHIAAGRDWAGKAVKQVGVLYIAAEGGHGFANRLVAARQQLHIPDDAPFGLITVAPNLGLERGDLKALVDEIRAQIKLLGWQVGVIVIDTLSRVMFGADENSAADMGRFVKNADLISKAFRCLVIAVHHTGKNAENGMRGSSALHGAADVEWEVAGDDEGKTCRTAKQKDGAPDNLQWRFHLYPVSVGVDETNEDVSSCAVKITSKPELVKQKSAGKNVVNRQLKGQKALALKAMRKAVEEMGERIPETNHTPPNTRGVKRESFDIYAEKMGFLEGKTERVARATLDRLVRDLIGDKYLGRWGDWLWLVHATDETK